MLDYYRFVGLNLLEVFTDKGYIWEHYDLLQHFHDDEHNISEFILLAALRTEENSSKVVQPHYFNGHFYCAELYQ